MSLPGSNLRQRRAAVRDVVKEFDAFTKTVDEIKEEKRASGGLREHHSYVYLVTFSFCNCFRITVVS